jgi:hypothetical protein
MVVKCHRPLYIGPTTDTALRIDERHDREAEARLTLKSAKEVDSRSRSDTPKTFAPLGAKRVGRRLRHNVGLLAPSLYWTSVELENPNCL